MAKIADPKMTAKREKAFLKQKQAKQKSDVIARLQRESEALKRKVNRNNQNESGDEGMQEQMFADAAREMQIQNLEQNTSRLHDIICSWTIRVFFNIAVECF